jgi:LysM domain
MKVAKLAPAVALAFSIPAAFVSAEETPPAAAAETVEAPSAEAAAPAAAPEASEVAGDAAQAETLGPVGHDEQGRPGRIHIVQSGDTLWDISDAYLGTPWVWPSIWKDNTVEVENPHRIYPNERIWISPHEMRKLTDAEAAEMLARQPVEAPLEEAMPAAMADPDGPEPVRNRGTYRYTEIQTTGFVTLEELEGAATIVGAPANRTMLTDHTLVDIGLGQGEVAVGDQLDIFRPGDMVIDPSTGRNMGRVTIQLGWMEVTEVHEETASGIIRLSRREMLRGDHVMPRRMRSAEIPIGDRVEVDGVVAFTPDKRVQMGSGDVLYLNRGSRQGLVVGSPVELFEERGDGWDAVREEDRALADRVLAKAIVVDAYDDTAVAVVTTAQTDLTRGNRFRGSDSIKP